MVGLTTAVIGLRAREDAQRESFGMALTALATPRVDAQKVTTGMVRFANPTKTPRLKNNA
jgi:hypothetical protein